MCPKEQSVNGMTDVEFKKACVEYTRDVLECTICQNVVNDAVQLTCRGQHVFCFGCMADFFKARNLSLISCPSCRHGDGSLVMAKHVDTIVEMIYGNREIEGLVLMDYTMFLPLLRRRFPRQFHDSEGSGVILAEQMALFVHNVDHMRALEHTGVGDEAGWRNKRGRPMRVRRETHSRAMVTHSDDDDEDYEPSVASDEEVAEEGVRTFPGGSVNMPPMMDLSGIMGRLMTRMHERGMLQEHGGLHEEDMATRAGLREEDMATRAVPRLSHGDRHARLPLHQTGADRARAEHRYNLRARRPSMGYGVYILVFTLPPAPGRTSIRFRIETKASRAGAVALARAYAGRITHALVLGVNVVSPMVALLHTGLEVTDELAQTIDVDEVPEGLGEGTEYIVRCYPSAHSGFVLGSVMDIAHQFRSEAS
jgi:hypothetical protein